MRRNHRTRSRALALAFAAAVHVGLFVGLVLGQRPAERFVEMPAMSVALVEPPRASHPEPPRPPPPPLAPRRPAAAPILAPPALAPAPPIAAAEPGPVSDADRAALNQAVIPSKAVRRPHLRERCESGQYAPEEKQTCLRMLAGPRRTPSPDDEGGEFAAAAKRKDAIAKYCLLYTSDAADE